MEGNRNEPRFLPPVPLPQEIVEGMRLILEAQTLGLPRPQLPTIPPPPRYQPPRFLPSVPLPNEIVEGMRLIMEAKASGRPIPPLPTIPPPPRYQPPIFQYQPPQLPQEILDGMRLWVEAHPIVSQPIIPQPPPLPPQVIIPGFGPPTPTELQAAIQNLRHVVPLTPLMRDLVNVNGLITVTVYRGSNTLDNGSVVFTDFVGQAFAGDNILHGRLQVDTFRIPVHVIQQLLIPIPNIRRQLFLITGQLSMDPLVVAIVHAQILQNIYQVLTLFLPAWYHLNAIIEITIPTNQPVGLPQAQQVDSSEFVQNLLPVVQHLPQQPIIPIQVPLNQLYHPGLNPIILQPIQPIQNPLNYNLQGVCKFPYEHFINPDKKDENCIVNILIAKYSDPRLGKKQLVEKNIRKFFQEDTTLGRVIEFAKLRKISYQVLDITGKKLYSGVFEESRPALAIMIFNNHACVYDGPLNEKINFVPTLEHTIPGWFTNVKCVPKYDKMPISILVPGLGKTKPNFTFKSERDVIPQSLCWEDNDFIRQQFEGYDMTKAFFNCFMSLDPKQPIPIFAVTDEIQVFENERGIDHSALYFITEEAASKLIGQRNNVLFGFRIEYEYEKKRLKLEDITHVRYPKYTTKCEKLQTILKDEMMRFALYNGILGKISTKPRYVTSIMKKEDLELILKFHPNTEYQVDHIEEGITYYSVLIQIAESKHRYLNNRNYYAFIVETCNHYMMTYLDEFQSRNPNAQLVKLWVDCMAFKKYDKPFDDGFLLTPKAGNIVFRTEDTIIYGRKSKVFYIDPEKLQLAMKQEILDFKQDIVVVTGAPGTGKTYHVRMNMSYDFAGSFLNVTACQNDGKTLHKLFGLHDVQKLARFCRKYHSKTIWIDEFSQIPAWVWSVLVTVSALYKTRFLFSGDPNQLPPYKEIVDYEYNLFFATILAGSIEFTKSWRNNDQLFELVQTFRNNGRIPKNLIRTDWNPDLNLHLTLTRNLRDFLNNEICKRRGLSFENASIGLKTIALKSIKTYNIQKGSIYLITGSSEETVQLNCIFPPKKKHEISVPKDQYLSKFDVGYAMTIDSCQGITVEEPFAIYEVNKIRQFTQGWRRIYVALTRARNIEQLSVYLSYPGWMDVPPSTKKFENETFSKMLDIVIEEAAPLSELLENGKMAVIGTTF